MALERESIEKIVLIVIVLTVAAVCAWIFYLGPNIGTLCNGRTRSAELKEEYKKSQQIIARAKRSRKKLEGLQEDIKNFDRNIPPETKDEWILGRVNEACRKLNMRYETLIPQDSEEFKDKVTGKVYVWKKVKLSMRCSYHDLGMFLNMIENSSPFIVISGLTIEAAGEKEEDRQETGFSVSYVARKG